MSILQKIQSELKAPKSNFNNFGKYNYRSAEDIQEALKPILAKYSAAVVITDDIVLVGNRIYIRSTVKLLDENLKVLIETVAFAREPENKKGMDEAQVSGATSSYSHKYALGSMFLLDDTKDSDSMNNNSPEPKLNGKKTAVSIPIKDKKKSKEDDLSQARMKIKILWHWATNNISSQQRKKIVESAGVKVERGKVDWMSVNVNQLQTIISLIEGEQKKRVTIEPPPTTITPIDADLKIEIAKISDMFIEQGMDFQYEKLYDDFEAEHNIKLAETKDVKLLAMFLEKEKLYFDELMKEVQG